MCPGRPPDDPNLGLSCCEEKCGDSNGQLERYRDQVGGHCALLKPQGTRLIYKPLSDTEKTFYEKMNNLSKNRSDIDSPLRALLDFLPRFYGTGTVRVQTTAPGQTHAPCSDRNAGSNNSGTYLVLEDLLSGFRKPCVMDIKLGRLQRTLGASPEKRRRQLEKSLKTTSNALGFRLCGMQSYNAKSDALLYRDKYWGRKLKREKIDSALREWFSNGLLCHYDLVQLIYMKIIVLIRAIRELRHYRFWSSSVLWCYDGAIMEADKRRQSIEVRLIDFANVTLLPDNPSPDTDMLLGLENLAGFLSALMPGGVQSACRLNRVLTGNRRFEQRLTKRGRRRRMRYPNSDVAPQETGSEEEQSSDSPLGSCRVGGGTSRHLRLHQWSRWQSVATPSTGVAFPLPYTNPLLSPSDCSAHDRSFHR